MKRGIFTLVVGLVCGCAFVATPFHTAWSIRAAAKSGDTGYLSNKIEWATVKIGLKESLTRLALRRPGSTATSVSGPSDRTGLSLWQRVKSFSTRVFIAGFVERYGNAEGFETLASYGRAYRGVVDDEARRKLEDAQPIWERVARVWKRVRRAEFKSLTRFELDLADKDDENRIYCGVLELKGWDWKLTGLQIEHNPPAQVAQVARPLP